MTTRPDLDDRETAVLYLSGKLSNPEREAFEGHYLAHPNVVEELELDAKFKAGLICIRDANELDRLSNGPKRLWAMMPIAIAACALFAVIVIAAFRDAVPGTILASSEAALHRPFGSRLAAGATYTLLQTRTGLYDAVIPRPQEPQAIRLQMVLDIEVPTPLLAVTMASIADDGARTDLAVLHQLRADANGVVTLFLDPSVLELGTYGLSVSGDTLPTGVPESTFVLKIVASQDSPLPR